MSNRTVREPAEALAQRLGKIEERMRAMSLRTWPGALRTATAPPEVNIPAADAMENSVVLTLQALPGRWVVFGQTCLIMAVNPPEIDFRVNVFAVDPATGEEPDDCTCDVLMSRYYIYEAAGAGFIHQPMTVIGNVSSERIIDIQLTVSNLIGDGFLARLTHLLLMPV